MKLTEFSVKRPVTTIMLFLGLVLFGMMSYTKLAVNLMPDVKYPALTVSTFQFGATPEEIESEITEKIEKEVATISGLKQLKSLSMSGNSLVILEFNLSKDIDKAMSEVKSKLELVIPNFSKDVEKPIVQPFNFSDVPVLNLIVSGNMSGSELYDYVDVELKDKLLQIQGVSKLNIEGGEIREVRVLADKRSMYEVQTNLSDMAQFIQANNIKLSAGSFELEHRKFQVETKQQFNSVSDVGSVYIPSPTGIRQLQDFTNIRDTVKKIESKAIYFDIANGKRFDNVVNIGVMKKSNANEVQVTDEVKTLVTELKKELPEGIEINIPFDDSEYTKSAVDDSLMNVVLGIILTGLILFFFLHDIRTTIIVSISVPVSLIGTFMAIRMFDGSLNFMTLMSFSVAIGALISNSIVVIENIMRLRNEGMEIKEAAITGTKEVMMAIIASTGTNLVVFLPIASMSSIVGAFFKEYALTISAATIFSLLVSFTLTPMLASLLLKNDGGDDGARGRGGETLKFNVSTVMKRFFENLENRYERSLAWLISNKIKPVLLFVLMLGIFISTGTLMSSIGVEMEPQEDNGNVFIQLEMPAGTKFERTTELLQLVEEKINSHAEVKSMLSILGSKDASTTGSNLANASLKLVKKEERTISNIVFAEMLSKELQSIPEIKANVSTADSESGAPIQFLLKSKDPQDLIIANDLMMEQLAEMSDLLNYQSSYRKGNPVIGLVPKQRILAEQGLSVLEIATAIRASIYGVKASVLKEKGKEYDITLSYPSEQVNTVEKIRALPIFTTNGVFTVAQLMEVEYRSSQAQIVHLNKEKTVEFFANPAPGIVAGDMTTIIETAFAKSDFPTSIKFEWAGSIKDMQETMSDMLITFGIALLLMYMLLASLLESTWQPIIIFTTVPMAMIGVFLFMYFGGHTMNIMSIMAIVTLLGLVVNDDILIHDYTEQLVHKGMKLREATLLAGKRKMKTVIMTTVAIIVGMLPNALGIGDAGAAYRTPMAIVTIGGMITSTILTLYLIPSLFFIIRNRE